MGTYVSVTVSGFACAELPVDITLVECVNAASGPAEPGAVSVTTIFPGVVLTPGGGAAVPCGDLTMDTGVCGTAACSEARSTLTTAQGLYQAACANLQWLLQDASQANNERNVDLAIAAAAVAAGIALAAAIPTDAFPADIIVAILAGVAFGLAVVFTTAAALEWIRLENDYAAETGARALLNTELIDLQQAILAAERQCCVMCISDLVTINQCMDM